MTRIYKKIPTKPEDLKEYTVNTWVYLKGFGTWKEDVIFHSNLYEILDSFIDRISHYESMDYMPLPMLIGYTDHKLACIQWIRCFLVKEVLIISSLFNKVRLRGNIRSSIELNRVKPAINKYRINYLRNLQNERTIYRANK